jgi:pimeloyl-ACP methyl ester carboxylesterase
MEYSQSGKGPALVLIGGWGASQQLFDPLRAELETSFTVITPNNRGIGQSSDPGTPYTVTAMADDIASLMDKLGHKRYHVLGISLGGFVAQDLAHRYPDRVEKLILTATSMGGQVHVAPAPEVMQFFAASQQMPLEERVRKGLAMALHPSYVENQPQAMETLIQHGIANPANPATLSKQTLAAMFFDFSQKAAEIKVPTLVLHGTDDRIVVLANGENLAKTIPNATLKTISNSGHLPILDQVEISAKHIATFLK